MQQHRDEFTRQQSCNLNVSQAHGNGKKTATCYSVCQTLCGICVNIFACAFQKKIIYIFKEDQTMKTSISCTGCFPDNAADGVTRSVSHHFPRFLFPFLPLWLNCKVVFFQKWKSQRQLVKKKKGGGGFLLAVNSASCSGRGAKTSREARLCCHGRAPAWTRPSSRAAHSCGLHTGRLLCCGCKWPAVAPGSCVLMRPPILLCCCCIFFLLVPSS